MFAVQCQNIADTLVIIILFYHHCHHHHCLYNHDRHQKRRSGVNDACLPSNVFLQLLPQSSFHPLHLDHRHHHHGLSQIDFSILHFNNFVSIYASRVESLRKVFLTTEKGVKIATKNTLPAPKSMKNTRGWGVGGWVGGWGGEGGLH